MVDADEIFENIVLEGWFAHPLPPQTVKEYVYVSLPVNMDGGK